MSKGYGDGYTASTDVDDNNACVPVVGPNCTGIDADVDGFFSNYATDHTLYDANDTDTIQKTSGDKDAFFFSRSSTVHITGNYHNQGGATYYEFSCVQVDNNYENDFGLEIVEETCLTVNINYINRGNLINFFDIFASKGLFIINAKFHIKGNLENHGKIDDVTIGLHTYDGFQHLWVEGNVLNYDAWGADVESDYCIQGNNDIPSSRLKGDASCGSIANKFEDCACNN